MNDEPRVGNGAQSLLARIELGKSSTYWESNLVDGRKSAARKLISWMVPLEGRTVVDVGCGRGTLALQLSQLGARAIALDIDLTRALSAAARASEHGARVEILVADMVRQPWAWPPDDRRTDWLLWEVVEHLSSTQLRQLLEQAESSRIERLYLGSRVSSRLARTAAALGAGDELPTIESTQILREIHLETDLRLKRTETITHRNCALLIAELTRSQP